MNDKEKIIKEQRCIEANRKGLMGMEGKFGCILRNLGEPIIEHTGGWFTSNEMEDIWELPDETQMPEFDEDEPVIEVGLSFSAMSSGMNLEIFHYHDASDRGWRRIENGGPGPGKELSVWYKGNLVFCESNDELFCYTPSPEWENMIDKLYALAKEKEANNRRKQILENREEIRKSKLSWLERIKLRWGI